MEDALLGPDSMQETLLADSIDLDLMDELLSEEAWLGTGDGLDLLRRYSFASSNSFESSYPSPLFELENRYYNPNPRGYANNGNVERPSSSKIPTQLEEIGDMTGTQLNPCTEDFAKYSIQLSELGKDGPSSWSIETKANTSPMLSLKERVPKILTYIKDSYRDCDVLVQIWLPMNNGGQQVLTTYGQPFSLNPHCQRLINYRGVSTSYQFSAEENSKVALGLPGRVFLGKVPEWSPDVRYFNNYEYPRVIYAQRYDVRGTLAIPIFQHGSRICLGVIEVVMTTERINYRSDLEHICSALQAVDLNSSEVLSVPHVKMENVSYLAALPEISVVLKAVCQAHGLPLAQTWIPCIYQGKSGSRHSDENYKNCVSTVDASCYVNDPFLSDFHEACSEHHLLRGQGVVGKAFTTNQPCFSSDITAFNKAEYPLSHHARMFGLRAAVAIRLRSVHTGNADFVLEFFLPKDCLMSEEQKVMLNSLSLTLQQVCRTLRVVTAKELEGETVLQVKMRLPSDGLHGNHLDRDSESQDTSKILVVPRIGITGSEPSLTASIMEAQLKENDILCDCASPEFEGRELQGFDVAEWGSSEVEELPEDKPSSDCKVPPYQYSAKNINESGNSFSGRPTFPNGGKAKERKRTKTEKTISLQLLRQYFAGSLKDAAKSIGVCPTTLKRICRQHGITRWPSRKIKKVGHSLRKLKVVIDSVQGVDGPFQLSSLYANFPKSHASDANIQKTTGKNTICAPKQDDNLEFSIAECSLLMSHASASNSLSSSGSQASGSSHCCSTGSKQSVPSQGIHAAKVPIIEVSSQGTPGTLARSQSLNSLGENSGPRNLSPPCQNTLVGGLLRVKAMYGEEKIRFSLQPTWGIRELKQEITKRFHIGNMNLVDLKYLDDESEWVLLTCDADLQECIDVYRTSSIHTVKISVHHASQPSTSSLGSGL